jgi:cell division septal protein FtsQ
VSQNRKETEIPITPSGDMIKAERFLPPSERMSAGRRRKSKTILVALCLTAVATVCLLVLNSFKISKINVIGNKAYTDAELRAASEALGDGFFSYSASGAEDRILSACPLLNSVEVKKSFPNRITVTVEECDLAFYTFIDGEWYSFGTNIRLNEKARYNDRFVEEGLTLV